MAARIQRLYANADTVAALDGSVATGARLNIGAALDSDGDNVPDRFETQIAAATGAANITDSSDTDGDGTLDIWEFRAGTDPTDPADRFQISQIIEDTSGDLNSRTLVFPSAQGRTYSIYSTPSLDQPFTVFQSDVTGTSPENTFSIPVDGESGFYQVRLDWPE